MTQKFLTNSNQPNWLEDAIEIDTYLGSIIPQSKAVSDILFSEVIAKLTNIRDKYRYKEALKLILLNLYVAYCFRKTIRYSRNKNNYRRHERYGLLHFKRDRILPIIDVLEELDYIQQSIGHYDSKRAFGRQTRMWAMPKLIMLFQANDFDHPGIIQREQPEEIIQLRDESKMCIGYSDEQFIIDMRNNLTDYNNFISQQNITVEVPQDAEINQFYMNKLHKYSLTGVVEINQVLQNKYLNNSKSIQVDTGSNIVHTDILQYNHNIGYQYDTDTLYTMTNPIRSSINVAEENPWNNYHNIPDWYKPENRLISKKTRYLSDYYPIDNTTIFYDLQASGDSEHLTTKKAMLLYGLQKISYSSKYNKLHRVFNNNSFDEGGRFYGSYHLEMPSDLRRYIRINGNPTVELDYSALHIRMLYHLESKNYTADPYSLLCQDQSERIVHKLANLVAINAGSEKTAVGGIRKKFREEGVSYDLTDKALMKLICNFKEAHKPIAHYLCSGIGRQLQNKDSHIAAAILNRLTRDGIPCLPVHDSFIVEAEYEDTLHQVMIEEYEKIMGFQPVVAI